MRGASKYRRKHKCQGGNETDNLPKERVKKALLERIGH